MGTRLKAGEAYFEITQIGKECHKGCAIREQVASAISLIVQINREKDGSRKVTCVSEITKMEGDIITMQDLFVFRQDGWTPDGKMTGRYVPTGSIPTFMDEIRRAGLDLDISIFTPDKENRRGGGSFA